MLIYELQIPVPWGHVAVKAWGNQQNIPVLVAHGMNDNAGSFDRLIPYLPRSFYYICIDLPGHGKSSHFPAHVPIQMLNVLFTYKIIMDYLDKKKYIIIGHSWGGLMAILFTQIYPILVSKLILLDIIYPYPISVNYFKHFMRERIGYLVRLNSKIATGVQPSYTYDEALDKCCKSRIYGELEKEAAKILLKRSLIPADNGKFKFSTDPRTVAYINAMFDTQFVNELMQKHSITCPVIFITATDSLPVVQYFKSLLKELQKNNNECFIRKVEGNHDVHMTQPKGVAEIISAFLNYRSSKL